ncbi:MAG: hypothetical protein ACP5GU_03115 [Thermoprotei archaeon]
MTIQSLHKNLTLKQKLRDFFFGMFLFDMHRELLEASKSYKEVEEVLLLGEFLGVPLLSNYYTLRLIPYFIKDLDEWKKKQMMEKDLLEELGHSHID